jgi:hypothetical protein
MKKDIGNKAGKKTFMNTKDGDDAVVEGIISVWNITASGCITKDKEVSFEYDM